ncbi:hypothetical protein QTO34_006431 [Cnephaeus nilssonii]|uniref:Uncharacterized protein n=1 Tax=Cnephaeus nilssonii TaxID=3371016 RepID=A0AA40HLF5_CNENI|nr:hypothetical protein QTO34_006431 [Eptesicus nilssonii]
MLRRKLLSCEFRRHSQWQSHLLLQLQSLFLSTLWLWTPREDGLKRPPHSYPPCPSLAYLLDKRSSLLSLITSTGNMSSLACPQQENVFPQAGKKALSDCGVHVPAKQGLDIYTDEPEQEDRNSCTGRDGMAFEDVYEVDNSKPSEDAADFGTDVINATGNAEETHQCLREAEIRYRPKVYFMRKQPEGMGMILVDRLI